MLSSTYPSNGANLGCIQDTSFPRVVISRAVGFLSTHANTPLTISPCYPLTTNTFRGYIVPLLSVVLKNIQCITDGYCVHVCLYIHTCTYMFVNRLLRKTFKPRGAKIFHKSASHLKMLIARKVGGIKQVSC